MPKVFDQPVERYVAVLFKSDAERLRKRYAAQGKVSAAVRVIVHQFLQEFEQGGIGNEVAGKTERSEMGAIHDEYSPLEK